MWHLLLLNFIWLEIAQLSSLSRSLCKASLPSRESTAPPSLVLLGNLLNAHSIPASRSFIKTLKSTDPKIEPWGTPLVTHFLYTFIMSGLVENQSLILIILVSI